MDEERKNAEAADDVSAEPEELRRKKDATAAAVGIVKGLVSIVLFIVFLFAVVSVFKWVCTDGWDYLGRIGCSPKEKVAFLLLGANAAVMLFAAWLRIGKLSRQNALLIEMVELNKQFVDRCRPVFEDFGEFMQYEMELKKAEKAFIDKHNENTEKKGKAENEQGEGK